MPEIGLAAASSGFSSNELVIIGSACALLFGIVWWRVCTGTKSPSPAAKSDDALKKPSSAVKFTRGPTDGIVKTGETPPSSPSISIDPSIRPWAPPERQLSGAVEPLPRVLSRQKSQLLRGPNRVQLRLIQSAARRFLARKRVQKKRADLDYRDHIFKEIVETEQRYVNGLAHIRKDYMEPLRELSTSSRALLTFEEVQAIFSSIDVLHRVNTELLNGLQQRAANWTHYTKIGDVFLNLAPFLKSYASYVNNYNRAVTTLSEVRRKRGFAQFMKLAHEHAPGGLELPALLITPVQRLARYPLLLGDLIKYTEPTHPDYKQLDEALMKLKEIATRVNEDKRDAENVMRVLEIQDAIEDIDIELVAPHRRLIHEESLHLITLDAQPIAATAFIFTDVLVLARTVKPQVYQMLGRVDIRSVTVAAPDSLLSNYFYIRESDWVFLLSVQDTNARAKFLAIMQKLSSTLQTGIVPTAPRPRSASQAGLFRPFKSAKTDPIRWDQFSKLLSSAKCGVISKQGKLAKGWHHRWMHIADDTARLTASLKDLREGRVFKLADIRLNAAPALESQRQDLVLSVVVLKGSAEADQVTLCAESLLEKAEWVEALDRGMRQARRRYVISSV
eukprot:TRINITY_DN4134_c0_g7_i1.p1 TRINITY_DN4134_c0_g7~~TRINITY_DN4134_c0_g7_i1.p1  ORF type:complete len:618 (-),score=121.76 TRINITY_DN4134_c0_g7_i1:980-2833(-)